MLEDDAAVALAARRAARRARDRAGPGSRRGGGLGARRTAGVEDDVGVATTGVGYLRAKARASTARETVARSLHEPLAALARARRPAPSGPAGRAAARRVPRRPRGDRRVQPARRAARRAPPRACDCSAPDPGPRTASPSDERQDPPRPDVTSNRSRASSRASATRSRAASTPTRRAWNAASPSSSSRSSSSCASSWSVRRCGASTAAPSPMTQVERLGTTFMELDRRMEELRLAVRTRRRGPQPQPRPARQPPLAPAARAAFGMRANAPVSGRRC